jgi:hypothetical protein
MSVNSGGPHILLFERDQQLTTLLVSEFQLAGYECHPARTAVEVFDAIARYPIRLVLVNLAQPAAGRREFWVALDAQRRGRGVQVLTFRCVNIAGYGVDDEEESSRTVLTDMEVDGMMGVMNLIDGVRSRIPGSTTGPYSRIAGIPQENGSANKLNSQTEVVEPFRTPESASPTTASLSMLSTNPSLRVHTPPHAPSPETVNPTRTNEPGNPASGFTDKIRAVIYPSSRSVSQMPETNLAPQHTQNNEADLNMLKQPSSPLIQENAQQGQTQVTNVPSYEDDAGASKATSQQAHSVDANGLNTFHLRASPIQDIAIERGQEYRSGSSGAYSVKSGDVSGVAAESTMTSATSSMVPPSKEATPAGMTDLHNGKMMDEEINSEEEVIARVFAEMPRLSSRQTLNQPSSEDATSEDTLLNIVQSLPPVSSLPNPLPKPNAHVLSGRATRSLGSVLLEGNLVPQHRLEVAQRIQRMLRGVDMNYQLGEILLMFKLLTPDQLLAASLVSYGLISTAQIGSLGRIRQELHVIGLEYDLESLLVLFRILSPEQLREVRASWSG